MGNEVFIRSQKGLTITPEGEKVANYAKEMLQREEDIKVSWLFSERKLMER